MTNHLLNIINYSATDFNISNFFIQDNICNLRDSCPDLHQKLLTNCLSMGNVIPSAFNGLITVVWLILILMGLEVLYELLIQFKIIKPKLDVLGISVPRWGLRIAVAYWMARFINIWWLAKTQGLL